MTNTKGKRTKSGVFEFDDFRANLIIDRLDPIFTGMRAQKIKHLRSENSEDAVTWNVFRTLSKIDPKFWFEAVFETAFGKSVEWNYSRMTVELWSTMRPPPELTLYQGHEGDTEVDVCICTDHAILFIEAKYKSDISMETTNNPFRDQLMRNIDVGSCHAFPKEFYFALLSLGESCSPKGHELLKIYANDKKELLARLPHREDGLPNLKGVGSILWSDLATILEGCCNQSGSQTEQQIASNAIAYLKNKGISPCTTPETL